MRARIERWSTSLVVRIPQSLAAAVHLKQGSLVELALEDGKPEVTLADLLAGVTEENLHRAVDTGEATGNEVW